MKYAWMVMMLGAVIAVAAAYMTVGGEAGGSASSEGSKAQATLHDASGAVVGTVKLEQDGDSVAMKVHVAGVAPGFHGFHVHGTGVCAAPFTSAGGHYNPGASTHGSHAGD